ncbi:MAG: hypothetical protein WAN17_02960 [Candidatus Sulfotelmatobacter sp.]
MRNLLSVSSPTTHVWTAALARPAAAPRPMWGRALSPVHAAPVYRAAAAPQTGKATDCATTPAGAPATKARTTVEERRFSAA